MSSLRRIRSSRANGALSKGPVTEEGKQRSAMNAIRHGLLARCIVMQDESREAFEELLRQHIERLCPAEGVEFGIVEEMVASQWRLRRAWAIETRILDNEVAAQTSGDTLDRMAAAFSDLAARPSLGLIHRYETQLHRVYQRALKNLLLLRSVMPDEPSTAIVPPASPASGPSAVPSPSQPPAPSPAATPAGPAGAFALAAARKERRLSP